MIHETYFGKKRNEFHYSVFYYNDRAIESK